MMTTAAASRNAATSLLDSVRCLVAVNVSPHGGRPESVVSIGLPTTATAPVAVTAALTGLTTWATSSGMSWTLLSMRSLAVARKRTNPPFTQATSPATVPVFDRNWTVPSFVLLSTSV